MTQLTVLTQFEVLEDRLDNLKYELDKLEESACHYYDYIMNEKRYRFGWEREVDIKHNATDFEDRASELKEEIEEIETEILKIVPDYYC